MRPVPVPFARLFTESLDHVLRGLNRGEATSSGAISAPNDRGEYVTTTSKEFVLLKGDPGETLPLLRGLLWWSGAPESVRLTKRVRESVPLNLGTPTEERGPLVLELARLNTVRYRTGYRLDRTPLDEAARRRLKQRLDAWRADGPDADGWFDATTDDGGRLRFRARGLEDDPSLDGLTIVFDRLTHDAASRVYDLMSTEDLLLLPPVIAASAGAARQVTAPWPDVHAVASPGAFHEILAAGAYAWWAGESRR